MNLHLGGGGGGNSLCRSSLYWAWLTVYEKTFQVQGIHRWTALIPGLEVEESRLVGGIVLLVKTLERIGFGICLCM